MYFTIVSSNCAVGKANLQDNYEFLCLILFWALKSYSI